MLDGSGIGLHAKLRLRKFPGDPFLSLDEVGIVEFAVIGPDDVTHGSSRTMDCGATLVKCDVGYGPSESPSNATNNQVVAPVVITAIGPQYHSDGYGYTVIFYHYDLYDDEALDFPADMKKSLESLGLKSLRVAFGVDITHQDQRDDAYHYPPSNYLCWSYETQQTYSDWGSAINGTIVTGGSWGCGNYSAVNFLETCPWLPEGYKVGVRTKKNSNDDFPDWNFKKDVTPMPTLPDSPTHSPTTYYNFNCPTPSPTIYNWTTASPTAAPSNANRLTTFLSFCLVGFFYLV